MDRLAFHLVDPDRVREIGAVEVTHAELFDKHGKPKSGGLFDPYLGTVSRDYRCRTCRLDIEHCPGHPGFLSLNTPLYHVLTLPTLIKTMQCVCHACSRLLCDTPNMTFAARCVAAKRHAACPHCQRPVSKYGSSGGILVRNGDPMSPAEAFMVLGKIPQEQAAMFPFCTHPKHLILTVLPIPPPHVHPPFNVNGKRSLDDLTVRYGEIIRLNAQIAEESDKRAAQIAHLQTLVTSMFDSDSIVVTTRKTRPFKGLAQRIKGKEGRIRGNLTGKRVDFSSRAVITGDSTLYLHELGIPTKIATTMTLPEPVTERNKTVIERMLKKGQIKTVMRANGTFVDVRIAKTRVTVSEGDVVERYLRDGDWVMFNRQPTLHRMGMMAHQARIIPGNTIRLNLSATSPYNADMDGDACNVHVPQTLEARSELAEILDIRKNIVSSQANRPVIALVQDSMLAAYLLTRPDGFVDRRLMEQVWIRCGWTHPLPPPAILKPTPLWTGKQMVSAAFPPFDAVFGGVRVVDGELIDGTLTKKNVGGNGGLVHYVWLTCGPEACGDMISNLQFMAHEFLEMRGFSVGMADIMFGVRRGDDTRRIVDEIRQEVVRSTLRAYRNGLSRNDIEASVVSKLDHARDSSGAFVRDHVGLDNQLKCMVASGSKGSDLNIAQICACVGQQHISGGRPKPVLDGQRVLSHFSVGDPDPAAYGFVAQSYLEGLGPTEFFFHAQSGREGVIDTAVRTSDTGYTQRRLNKIMEDVSIAYDGTVRDSRGSIYQFRFGGDGFDPTYQMMQYVGDQRFMLPFVISEMERCARLFPDVEPTPEPDFDNERIQAWYHETERRDPVRAPFLATFALEACEQSRIAPGTAVGVIAAQSIGEISTQLALNSFHTSGAGASITSGGVPRLKELTNLNKDARVVIRTPCLDAAHGDALVAHYRKIPIGPCISEMDLLPADDRDEALAWSWEPVDATAPVMRVRLHKHKLRSYDLEVSDLVATVLRDMEVGHAWGTDLNAREACLYVTFERWSQDILFRSELERLFVKSGDAEIGDLSVEDSHVVFADTTLWSAFGVHGLDHTKTITSSVLDAYEALGVEAARAVFLHEIQLVFRNSGAYAHPHNFELLADVMFQFGRPRPVNRYGVREDRGVLGKASFETSVQTLIQAAVDGVTDPLHGISERLMTGKRIQVGTGCFDALLTPLEEEPDETADFVFAPSSPTWSMAESDESEEESWVPT